MNVYIRAHTYTHTFSGPRTLYSDEREQLQATEQRASLSNNERLSSTISTRVARGLYRADYNGKTGIHAV